MTDEQSLGEHDGGVWLSVLTTYSIQEAHIVAGRLESEGVPSIIQREAAGEALGIYIGELGEVSLLVNPTDFDKAMAILKKDVEFDPSAEDDGLYDTDDPDLMEEDLE